MKDRMTGQPRGFGFITYADPLVVDKVIEDNHVFSGKQVEIKRTIPKGSASSGSANSKDFKTKKIFVGGIPTSLGEDELATFFSKYGKVVEHQIVRDHATNRSRGFGFVVFDSVEVVDELVSKGNMIDMAGNQVEIKKAEPKKGSNPPVVSRSRSRSFADKFSGYDGAYDSFDGRYGPGPIRASGAPRMVDGISRYNPYRAPGGPDIAGDYSRYAPWRAPGWPDVASGYSRYAPYKAPGGTWSRYGPERPAYGGEGSSIGGYGDCRGYRGESFRGDASRFGSGDEYGGYSYANLGAGGGPDSGPAPSYGGSYSTGGYSGGSRYHPY
ncbi:heterogeneous nuclear ribonucleoprotein A3 [Artemisia annua]|nr:heterogeneous nuclear ribonucleoprotein A3 [Artemisia annua]